ncbi:MAG: PTS sugar transporter subunit IIC [Pseudoflavonifractor sp.]
MSEQKKDLQEPTGIKKYFKEQNIELSFDRIAIKALGGMAQGLFASLLIGTILGTIGTFFPGTPVGEFLASVSGYTKIVQGAAMAIAIGYSIQCPPYVLYSLATVGVAANALGGAGGPLAVYFIALIAAFAGKLVSKRTPVDLIVTPTVTILVGVLVAGVLAPPIGKVASALGYIIMWAAEQQPFLMGIVVSSVMGIVLTLPISSAAVCAALSLTGLAGGAAVAGCCAHMVGFAVCSYRENKLNGLVSQGLGTSMLQVPNLLRKPVLWVPPVIASIVGGPIATCVFQLQMNGPPISSGMGTSGLVGPIGVVTGWLSPSEAAVANAAKLGIDNIVIAPGVMDWIGLIIICVVIPVVVSLLVSEFMRKKNWIKLGDYDLNL